MKWKQILHVLLLVFSLQYLTSAHADEAYLEKFLTYVHWTENLPTRPDSNFLTFVAEPSPLINSLRDKWLTQLAKNKDWPTYTQYYQLFQQSHTIESIDLQCYAQYALYQQGKQAEAIQNSQTLWLYGYSRPKACDDLFNSILHQHGFSNQLIEQRIVLALEARQFTLARALFKQLNPAQLDDINLLNDILRNPKRITTLKPGVLHGALYLVGLKQLVTHQMDLAIQLSQTPQAKQLMNQAEQQSFIAHIALYKSMRGQADAEEWLNRIQPAYMTQTLTEWRIREAILHQRWHKIIPLIANTPLQDTPAWQYWLARAYEKCGEQDKANTLYHALGVKRNYYGFLASMRLHQPLKFEFESTETNGKKLSIYKPILDKIQTNYHSGQAWMASRLLNAFSSELPKDEQSALAYWVKNDLHWHGKAVILSNKDSLNNELELRFPLAYRTVVHQAAQQYHIDEAFIYAIIRQESLFFEDNISAVGAKGLMQVMPNTAKMVTKQTHIRYTDSKELFDAEKNIHIGSAYIQQLARQFGAHPLLMTAAYNAGPKQIRHWQLHHEPKEIDCWIETLPWQETRNYLKNVMAFYAVYQYRLKQQPDLNPFLQPLY